LKKENSKRPVRLHHKDHEGEEDTAKREE